MCISLEMSQACSGKTTSSSCRIVELRMVMSRGPDERAPMHAVSILLSSCEGMSNRVLIDEGAKQDTALE